jgi:hypothetical protein
LRPEGPSNASGNSRSLPIILNPEHA